MKTVVDRRARRSRAGHRIGSWIAEAAADDGVDPLEDLREGWDRHIALRPDNATMTAAVAMRAVAPQLDTLSEAERQLMTEWLARAIDAGQT